MAMRDNKEWCSENHCRRLSHDFGNHTLPLLVVFRAKGGGAPQTHLFSGMLVYAVDRLMWITAGHVIDTLRDILAHSDVLVCRWSDTYPNYQAQSIPADLDDLLSRSLSLTPQGFDFGAAVIRMNTASNLLRNPKVVPLAENSWRKVPKTGRRYVVGLPSELVDAPIRMTGAKNESIVMAPMIVLPLTPISYPGLDEFDEFWSGGEDALYCRVTRFSDSKRYPVISTNGMSGGPVFVVNRAGKGWRYHLIGIQRSEKKEKRLVRIEPFAKVVRLFDLVS